MENRDSILKFKEGKLRHKEAETQRETKNIRTASTPRDDSVLGFGASKLPDWMRVIERASATRADEPNPLRQITRRFG